MIITVQILRDGALVNADGAVVLQDITNTFGVKRTDTGAVVVAAGTVVPNVSTGIYSYEFTSPAPNLTYEIAVYYTQSDDPVRTTFIRSESTTSAVSSRMNLIQARQRVRAWMRSNGYDSTLYPDAIIDAAISDCGEELARETILLQRVSDITLTVNDPTLPSMPTNFRPDRLMSAYLSGDNVVVVPPQWGYSPYTQLGAPSNTYGSPRAQLGLIAFQQLLELEYAYRTAIPSGQSGTVTLFTQQPQLIAFSDRFGTAGRAFPCPNQTYTMKMVWNDLFTNWVIGTQGAWSASVQYQPGDVVSSGGHTYQALQQSTNVAVGTAAYWLDNGVATLTAPASVTFQVPDDYMQPILINGAPGKGQFNEPLGAFGERSLQRWNDFVRKMADKGDLGEKYYQMEPARRGGGYMDGSLGFGNGGY